MSTNLPPTQQPPTPDGYPYDPMLGLPPAPSAPPTAPSAPGRAFTLPTPAAADASAAPNHAPHAPMFATPAPGAFAPDLPDEFRPEALRNALDAVRHAPPRLMEPSDIYAILDAPQSAPVRQSFVFNGTPMTLEFSTDALLDAEKFYELSTLLAGKRNKDGSPAAQTMTVQPPNGTRFTLSHPLYLASLNLLSATVTQPAMSPEEWAMLGKKIGAKGRQPGWHGIEDVADVATRVNGLSQQAVTEDEQGGEEDASPVASTTD